MRTALFPLRALAPLAGLTLWLAAPEARAQPEPTPGQAPAEAPAEAPAKAPAPPAATQPAEKAADKPVSPSEAPEGGAAPKGAKLTKIGTQTTSGGLRVSMTRVRGSDGDDTGFGMMFAGRGESYFFAGGGTGRGTQSFAIGGGSAGFEGALEASLAAGVRAPVDPRHGPFVRLGASGSLWGNRLIYSSLLALPQVYVGYQYLDGHTVFEIAARGGAVLAGRYNVGDEASRRLNGSFEVGGHAAVHVGLLRFESSLMRVDADSLTGRPVDILRASLCLWPGDLAVCADGNVLRGDVAVGPGGLAREARTQYVGLLVGWNLREDP